MVGLDLRVGCRPTWSNDIPSHPSSVGLWTSCKVKATPDFIQYVGSMWTQLVSKVQLYLKYKSEAWNINSTMMCSWPNTQFVRYKMLSTHWCMSSLMHKCAARSVKPNIMYTWPNAQVWGMKCVLSLNLTQTSKQSWLIRSDKLHVFRTSTQEVRFSGGSFFYYLSLLLYLHCNFHSKRFR